MLVYNITEKTQTHGETSTQIGNRNTMCINFETQPQTESTIIMEQFGDRNKMIIQLEDRRKTGQFELKSSGEGDIIMSLMPNSEVYILFAYFE